MNRKWIIGKFYQIPAGKCIEELGASSSVLSTLATLFVLAVILVACNGGSDSPQASDSLCSPNPAVAEPPEVPYTGTPSSLARHAVPKWYDDAKFGIMIHWGLYSVPAWAETTLDPEVWVTPLILILFGQEWYKRNPYTEWYANTIRIHGTEAQAESTGASSQRR